MKFCSAGFGPDNQVQVSLWPKDYKDSWGGIPGYFEHKEAQAHGLVPGEGGHLKVSSGTQMRDYIMGIQPWMTFFTARAVDALGPLGFTGYRLVRYTAEGLPSGDSELYRIIITGRCGAVVSSTDINMTRRLKDLDNVGLYCFDLNTWDGSDFFLPQPRNGVNLMTTTRVMKAVRKHKLKIPLREDVWTDRAAFEDLFER